MSDSKRVQTKQEEHTDILLHPGTHPHGCAFQNLTPAIEMMRWYHTHTHPHTQKYLIVLPTRQIDSQIICAFAPHPTMAIVPLNQEKDPVHSQSAE